MSARAQHLTLNSQIANSVFVRSVHGGLVMLIPVLLLGAFALIVKSFPYQPYQDFIATFASGALLSISNFVYNATYGPLSLYATMTVSYSFIREHNGEKMESFCAVVCALAVFTLLSGMLGNGFSIDSFGAKGMFIALVSATGSTALYQVVAKRVRERAKLTADGSDIAFRRSLQAIAPTVVVVLVAAIVECILVSVFHTGDLYHLFIDSISSLFARMGDTAWTGLLFIVVSTLLWFFGIHGSDVLEGAAAMQFTPATALNQVAVATGSGTPQIVTKAFLNSFVFMGGCGAALCLLIALLLFARRSSNRTLARVAALPMVFNVNEIMIFGLPVIYNPWLFVPFLATPVMAFLVAYGATAAGLVPVTTTVVEWTCPVIISGWISTGSPTGAILQVVIIAIGVCIYAPFVKKYDLAQREEGHDRLDQLVAQLQRSEDTPSPSGSRRFPAQAA